MTFFEQLRAHVGGLIRIKTELYWYAEQRWDEKSERFCILLDSTNTTDPTDWDATDLVKATEGGGDDYVLQLLIDDKPQWVVLNTKSFEIIK